MRRHKGVHNIILPTRFKGGFPGILSRGGGRYIAEKEACSHYLVGNQADGLHSENFFIHSIVGVVFTGNAYTYPGKGNWFIDKSFQ